MTKSLPIASKRRKLKPKRLSRKSVMKMLTLMSQPEEGSDPVKDFLTTGRVGRRNALPDILHDHARVSTADLPEKMDQLSTKAKKHPGNHHNQQQKGNKKTSQEPKNSKRGNSKKT